jgi:hypothetical protein
MVSGMAKARLRRSVAAMNTPTTRRLAMRLRTDTSAPKRRRRRRAGVALAALLSLTATLAVGTTPAAEAAFPGMNGLIAYASGDGSINTDEGTIFEAPEGTVSRDTAWSPDGTRLVFSSTLHAAPSFEFEDYELYVVNADGTGLTRLTYNSTYEYEPTWHPSGTEIAFVRNPLTGAEPTIRSMPVTPGAGSTLLVSQVASGTPAWSPDGTRLAYTAGSGTGDTFRLDVYVTGVGRLTSCCDNKSPSWSPDGSEIAFEREGNIYRMRSDGTNRELVIQEPFPTHSPAWSPDGHDIAARWFGHGRIAVYDAGGGFRIRDFGNGPGRIDWQPLAANTQPGANVTVSPVDPATGTAPVTLSFASVTAAGDTALTIGDAGPPPPTGFRLGDPPTYYELTTTATFAGTIEICIQYAGLTFVGDPRLFHEEGGVWADRTTSFDPVAQTVCGETTSLSPFALFEPAGDAVAPVIAPHEDLTANATSRAGAIVDFTPPDATDDVDGTVGVDCVPASGSQFAPGTTPVTCSATDAAGNPATASFDVTVLSFREQLTALRDQLAALTLEGQADVRRDSAVAFLDTALADPVWDADGVPATNDAGMNGIRNLRSAFGYLRSPNAALAAASTAIQLGLVELDGRIAKARFAEVSGMPEASASRVSQAQAHLTNAAAHLAASPPNPAEALLQYQKAWEVLKNEPPQFASGAPPAE